MTGRTIHATTTPPEDADVAMMELVISYLLRGGVLLSLAMVVAGTVVSFAHHPEFFTSHASLAGVTGPTALFPHTPGSVWTEITRFHGRAIVMAGLFTLIATPILRVGISILGFARQRDGVFVIITTTVFALLLLSLFLGKAGV